MEIFLGFSGDRCINAPVKDIIVSVTLKLTFFIVSKNFTFTNLEQTHMVIGVSKIKNFFHFIPYIINRFIIIYIAHFTA